MPAKLPAVPLARVKLPTPAPDLASRPGSSAVITAGKLPMPVTRSSDSAPVALLVMDTVRVDAVSPTRTAPKLIELAPSVATAGA